MTTIGLGGRTISRPAAGTSESTEASRASKNPLAVELLYLDMKVAACQLLLVSVRYLTIPVETAHVE